MTEHYLSMLAVLLSETCQGPRLFGEVVAFAPTRKKRAVAVTRQCKYSEKNMVSKAKSKKNKKWKCLVVSENNMYI